MVYQVTYSLEQVCGGVSVFPSTEKTENMIMNLLLPLCLRVGCGSKGKQYPVGVVENVTKGK